MVGQLGKWYLDLDRMGVVMSYFFCDPPHCLLRLLTVVDKNLRASRWNKMEVTGYYYRAITMIQASEELMTHLAQAFSLGLS